MYILNYKIVNQCSKIETKIQVIAVMVQRVNSSTKINIKESQKNKTQLYAVQKGSIKNKVNLQS